MVKPRFILILILLLFSLSACFGVIDNGIGASRGDNSEGDIGEKSLVLSTSRFTPDSAGQVTVELDSSGDSNSNASVRLFYCSIRQSPGCDPLAGSFINLTKAGAKFIGSLDFRSSTYSGADVIKYQFVSSDIDGLTGGDEADSFILPADSSKLRKITQLGIAALSLNGAGEERIFSTAVDSSGNVFLGGHTNGSLGEPNAGGSDVLVIKLKPTGELDPEFGNNGYVQLGKITAGNKADNSESATGIHIDSSGNIFVGGSTESSLGELNAGGEDVFVLKLTPDGLLDKSFSADGIVQMGNVTVGAAASGSERVAGLSVDSLGNIFIGGYTNGSFGETNAGSDDVFAIKLTSTGILDNNFNGDGIVQLGSITIGANAVGTEYVNAMAIDLSGSVYLSGSTSGSLGESNGGSHDGFVVKFTSLGVLDTNFSGDGIFQLGSLSIGALETSDFESIRSIGIDSSGGVFLGGTTLGSFGEANAGSRDVIVVKLTSAGVLDSGFNGDGIIQLGNITVGAAASGPEYVTAMTIDSSGSIYLAGYTSGSLGEANAGSVDAFVVKFNSMGALDNSFSGDGLLQFGSSTIGGGASNADYIDAIAVDLSGSLYLAGYTQGSVGEDSSGRDDALLLKINSSGAMDTSFSVDGIVQLGHDTVGGLSGVVQAGLHSVDLLGNVYIAGSVNGYLGEAIGGSTDVVVLKLTPSGVLSTSFSDDGIVQLGSDTLGAGASEIDAVSAISTDSVGNVYLAGVTRGSLGEANAGSYDIFVVKLTPTGVLDTSFSGDGIIQLGNVSIGAGASGDEIVEAMSIDPAGNIFVVGNTSGSLGEPNAGSRDAYVIKLTSAGVLDTSFSGDGIVQFGQTTLGSSASGLDVINAISLSLVGEIFLAGETRGALADSNAGGSDIFIAKLQTDGSLDTGFASPEGIIQLGGSIVGSKASGNEKLSSLALDFTGNIIVSGHTNGSFGEGNAGANDIFVVKITSTGSLDSNFSGNGLLQLGSNTLGASASGDEKVTAMSVDSSGNIFVGGYTMGSLGEASAGFNDAFVIKLNSTGALDTSFNGDGIMQLGSTSVGDAGSGTEEMNSMSISSSGDIYLSGVTYGSLGDLSTGASNWFLAHLSSQGELE